jgi:fumarate reductase subunit D
MMAAAPPGAGALLAKYLLGLLLIVVGLALVLFGVFDAGPFATLVGLALAALGVVLVVLKVIARNKAPPR